MKALHRLREVTLCQDAYAAADGADVLVIAAEWNEFKHLSPYHLRASMRQPVVLDAHNIHGPEQVRALGFVYSVTGRAYGEQEWE